MIKYKKENTSLNKEYIPRGLYIKYNDKIEVYKELTKEFNNKLIKAIDSKNINLIQKELLVISNEIFNEPRAGSVLPISAITKTIIERYFEGSFSLGIFKNFTETDYTTITHSMHVMALMIQYAKYKNFDKKTTEKLATAAMLHDIGKSELSKKVLFLTTLSDKDYEEIKKHTIYGYDILKNFGDEFSANIALNHHERKDGSGYPNGIKVEDKNIQLIGIIDSYEAMTSDHRLYTKVKSPYEALKELRVMVDEGKYDMDIYSDFVRSLSGLT